MDLPSFYKLPVNHCAVFCSGVLLQHSPSPTKTSLGDVKMEALITISNCSFTMNNIQYSLYMITIMIKYDKPLLYFLFLPILNWWLLFSF